MRLRQSPNPRRKDTLWIVQTLLALVSSVVFSLTITGITGNTGIIMAAVAAWLCVIYGILRKTKHESWFYIGVLVTALALSLVFRKQILEGFRIFWNTASDAMVYGTGWVIPEWELQMETQQALGNNVDILVAGLPLDVRFAAQHHRIHHRARHNAAGHLGHISNSSCQLTGRKICQVLPICCDITLLRR